ncbi:MAG TPA: hypothetical protein ENG03_03340 [Thioploca sp.]|nr:hypothetical protein [Thioploca sp.]
MQIMRQLISSTLLSRLSVIIWVVLWLLVFELLLYTLVPPTPVGVKPNRFQRYLEYGSSVEGKIDRMIAPTDEATTDWVAFAGWLEPSRWQTRPSTPKTADGLLVAIYGMSFSNHMGRALVELEPRITARLIAGPSAPPNYTYTAYLLDRKPHSAQAVCMGILASGVVGMTTMTGMNKSFERPAPFTFPKYRIVENQLEPIWPKVRNLTDLRRALNDKMLWEDYIQQLQMEDSYYDPFLFNHNVTDYFAFINFMRLSWAKKHARSVNDTVYGPNGFFEDSEVIPVLRLMIKEFAKKARSNGQLPILLLFNNRGFSDHLYQTLANTITEAGIPTVSSHTIASANDPNNFIPGDGHFLPKIDKQLAQAVLKIISEHKMMPEKEPGK